MAHGPPVLAPNDRARRAQLGPFAVALVVLPLALVANGFSSLMQNLDPMAVRLSSLVGLACIGHEHPSGFMLIKRIVPKLPLVVEWGA